MRSLLIVLLFAAPVSAQATWAAGMADKPVVPVYKPVAPAPTEAPPLASVVTTTPDGALAASAAKVAGRRGLSRRQRREMGLTISNVRRTVREINEEEDISEMTQEELSARTLDRIMSENPQGYQDAALDFEGILAFLEGLMPLILKLIAIFGV